MFFKIFYSFYFIDYGNKEYYTWLPHLQMCLCYYKLGDSEKAEEHNLIAYKYNLFSQEGQKQFALDVQALNVDSGTKKIIFSLKDIVIKQSIDIESLDKKIIN